MEICIKYYYKQIISSSLLPAIYRKNAVMLIHNTYVKSFNDNMFHSSVSLSPFLYSKNKEFDNPFESMLKKRQKFSPYITVIDLESKFNFAIFFHI